MLVHWVQTHSLPEGEAPPLAGQLLDSDQPVSLQGLRGRPVLVHFWSSWCPVCRLMDSSVARLAEGHQVLTVAMQSGDGAEVAAHLRERGLRLPVLVDPSGGLSRAWGLRGVPTSFVVDAAGRIRFREVGYTTEIGLRARLWAASLW